MSKSTTVHDTSTASTRRDAAPLPPFLSAAALASRCQGMTTHADGHYTACCPAHDDAHPSLSLSTGADGRTLLHCHAGCTLEAICAAFRVDQRHLTPHGHQRAGRIVATYDYHDAHGTLVYQTVRYQPKDFKQRRPDPTRPDAWLWNLHGVTRVPFHLPQALAAIARGEVLYVVEGEKDVLALEALGLAATCNVGGAGKWTPAYSQMLAGAAVVMLPDNDGPGRTHAQEVAWRSQPHAQRVTVVALPDVPEKGDVSDWITAGGTAQALRQLAQSTPAWTPAAAEPAPTPQLDPPPGRYAKVIHMDQVDAQPLEWLWWPYLPKGALTMLDGDPGIGKSLFTLYLGAIVSNGYPLPDQQGKLTLPTGTPGVVILLSAEDSVTHTIKQRLTASGANQQHIKVVTSYVDEQGREHPLTLDADHRPLLEQVLHDWRPALVIVDPIQAFLGKMDMHRANETRPFMRDLQTMAETYNTSLVCVRHPAKPGQTMGKAIHRGMGSVDFIGAVRSGLFVEQNPTDPDKVLLCHSKHNLSLEGRTQVFDKHGGLFQWAGITRLRTEHIAGQARGPHPYAFLEACFWLEAQFEKTTTHGAKELEEFAVDADLNWRVVKDAKRALGITSRKVGKTSWLWIWPPLSVIAPPAAVFSSPTSPTTPTTATSPSSDSRPSSDHFTPGDHGAQGVQNPRIDRGEGGEGDGGDVGDVAGDVALPSAPFGVHFGVEGPENGLESEEGEEGVLTLEGEVFVEDAGSDEGKKRRRKKAAPPRDAFEEGII